jgi:hypothetical protein
MDALQHVVGQKRLLLASPAFRAAYGGRTGLDRTGLDRTGPDQTGGVK